MLQYILDIVVNPYVKIQPNLHEMCGSIVTATGMCINQTMPINTRLEDYSPDTYYTILLALIHIEKVL